MVTSPENVRPGSPVSVVFYQNGQPMALAASVSSQKPFAITTNDANARMLEIGKRALLIMQDQGAVAKAEAQVMSVTASGDEWHIEIGKFGWEEVDRRRYPRHPVQIPVTVKAVLERNGNAQLKYVEAVTEDLSLGGAWIKSEDHLKTGSLVEFQAELFNGETVRVLAIVAWSADGEQGVGLEFVDFLGGSQYHLHSYLTKAA